MKKTWTKTELKVFLKRLAHRLGHLPERADIVAVKNAPPVALFYRKFGSLADAFQAAGLLKGE